MSDSRSETSLQFRPHKGTYIVTQVKIENRLMKSIASFFKQVASGASKITGGSSLRGKRAFNAYRSEDYEAMVRLCSEMSPA